MISLVTALVIPLLALGFALRVVRITEPRMPLAPFAGAVLSGIILYVSYQALEAEQWYRLSAPADAFPTVPRLYVALAIGLGLGSLGLWACTRRTRLTAG